MRKHKVTVKVTVEVYNVDDEDEAIEKVYETMGDGIAVVGEPEVINIE